MEDPIAPENVVNKGFSLASVTSDNVHAPNKGLLLKDSPTSSIASSASSNPTTPSSVFTPLQKSIDAEVVLTDRGEDPEAFTEALFQSLSRNGTVVSHKHRLDSAVSDDNLFIHGYDITTEGIICDDPNNKTTLENHEGPPITLTTTDTAIAQCFPQDVPHSVECDIADVNIDCVDESTQDAVHVIITGQLGPAKGNISSVGVHDNVSAESRLEPTANNDDSSQAHISEDTSAIIIDRDPLVLQPLAIPVFSQNHHHEDQDAKRPGFSPATVIHEILVPEPLAIPTFDQKYDQTNKAMEQASLTQTLTAVAESEKTVLPRSHYERATRSVKKWLHHNYYLTEEPTLILPSAPTDVEKEHFLITHRFSLCVVGVFAFLASSSGIWLFTISSNVFYWFGLFTAFLQVYFALFHLIGLITKNFDYEAHKKILQDNPITDDSAPTVDIFLPCCKEPLEILENKYKYVQKIEYPEGRLKVHMLDDGAMAEVKELATRYSFNYICREDRPRLKKAGNLRWAFARTDGAFFVIYDTDFCPRHDFVTELMPRMKENPEIAIIQTPQYFRTLDDQTWVERGAGAVQELFYRYIQVNRNRWGGAICVGSNAMYRRAALVEMGGMAEVGASEDVFTGFYAVDKGWKLYYMPLCMACGICPDTPRAFFSQQVRWCQGSTSLLINRDFWQSNLTKTQKMCYLSGMLYYSAPALTIFINPLPGLLLLWFKIEYLLWYNLAFAVPILIYGWFVYCIWSCAKHSMCVQLAGVIQQYAYLLAIKDRIVGTSFTWVPSGDNKAHQSHRYCNMRWLCISWTFTWNGFFVAGCVYRLLQGYPWYHFLPLILLNTWMLYKVLPFMLAR